VQVGTQLIDVGGHRLSARVAGTAEPVVVLEAHLGGDKSVWKKVWREVATFSTVCLYDRAGLGNSEPGPVPRTIHRTTQDLRRLLRALSPAPPYVLVGHSFGGLIIQAFARRYPTLIGGVVLVDSTHAQQATRLEPLLTPTGRAEFNAVRGAPNPEFVRLHRWEEAALRYGAFPSVPLRVLTSLVPVAAMQQFAAPGAARRAMAMIDRELARLSPRGRLIPVANSGHFIQLDQPDLLARQIRAVVREVRGKGSR
jgi:pimeloyl-ACP methyl ester carboxylesterase